MKPKMWDSMTDRQKMVRAKGMLKTWRGAFILSKALDVAVETLKKESFPPVSDIEDMEMLIETMYPISKAVRTAEVAFKERLSRMAHDE